MCLKRLLFFILSLLLLQSLAFSQAKSQQNKDLWNSIDWNLTQLENEQQFSQERLKILEQKQAQSEQALIDKELLCQSLESSLQKSEQDMKKWKNLSIVLGTTTVTFGVATVALIVVMVNK